jgi:hypothetical protein
MSLSKIKVSNKELLTIVTDNKKKHDEIYEAAEAGYWQEASEFLKKYQKDTLVAMKKQYRKTVKDLKKQVVKELKMVEQKKKSGYYYMNKPFPENHSEDYQTVIRKLELSVEPELELETGEFDCFVQNKWSWRQSFLNTNAYYANSYAISGSCCSASYSLNSSLCLGTGSLMNSLSTF